MGDSKGSSSTHLNISRGVQILTIPDQATLSLILGLVAAPSLAVAGSLQSRRWVMRMEVWDRVRHRDETKRGVLELGDSAVELTAVGPLAIMQP
jgi:hypothetical protein